MKSYKDLEIYKLSYDLAIKVHKISLRLPRYEMYEEGSQVRKSSKGVTSCIAEGYGRKKYKAEFIKFLVYAHASCDERIVYLNFIEDIHSSIEKEVDAFIKSYEELNRKMSRFIDFVEKEWNVRKGSFMNL